MKNTIYPCLWFDNQAHEAAEFYCSTFKNARLLSSNPIVSHFELNGTKFMGLNGGSRYAINSSISYYVYCENEEEISRLYKKLSENGSILMPLDRYEWSEKYAWISDKYGVNWQLDIDTIHSTQQIVPSLLFANEKKHLVEKAMQRYTQLFSNSSVLIQAPYKKESGMPEGSLLFAQYKLYGFIFNSMSSPTAHKFDFTPGNSFVIECDTQKEIDYYWAQLGEGGRYDMCGWLTDMFGVSWQIVPAELPALMADPKKSSKVIEAFLKMQKFDIETLKNV